VLEEKLSTKAMVKRTPLLFLATFIATLLATFLAIFLFVPPLWAQKSSDQPPAKGAAPAESKVPPTDAARVNSVKPSAESLAKGKKLYGIDCAMCHGKDGDGKGDMASDMKNVTDFTNPDALKNRTDGELFYVIRKGKGEMPPEGDRAKDDDIWNLVNYIRSLAKK
jgi:mono/diheme cytochrome c family protein